MLPEAPDSALSQTKNSVTDRRQTKKSNPKFSQVWTDFGAETRLVELPTKTDNTRVYFVYTECTCKIDSFPCIYLT